MYKKFKKLEIPDQLLSRFQDNVEQAISELPATQIIQGRLVSNVTLTSGSVNNVEHKLGRKLLGWFPVRVRAQATLWDSQDSNTNNADKFLSLNTSATVTVDLWVF